jgi:hypothetical protein
MLVADDRTVVKRCQPLVIYVYSYVDVESASLRVHLHQVRIVTPRIESKVGSTAIMTAHTGPSHPTRARRRPRLAPATRA